MENELVDAIKTISYQLKYLGNGNAGTQMGAIENHAKETKESGEAISESICNAGDQIATGLEHISTSIDHLVEVFDLLTSSLGDVAEAIKKHD